MITYGKLYLAAVSTFTTKRSHGKCFKSRERAKILLGIVFRNLGASLLRNVLTSRRYLRARERFTKSIEVTVSLSMGSFMSYWRSCKSSLKLLIVPHHLQNFVIQILKKDQEPKKV